MKDHLFISDIDAIKALSDPQRLKILHVLQRLELASATTLAQELQESAAKINYHLKQLEKYGIIYLAETRTKGNLSENFYAPAAKQYHIQRDITSGDDAQYDEARLQTIKEMNVLLTEGMLDLARAGRKHHFMSTVSYGTYYLTPEEIEVIRNSVLSQLEAFSGRQGSSDKLACNIGFLLLDMEQESDRCEA